MRQNPVFAAILTISSLAALGLAQAQASYAEKPKTFGKHLVGVPREQKQIVESWRQWLGDVVALAPQEDRCDLLVTGAETLYRECASIVGITTESLTEIRLDLEVTPALRVSGCSVEVVEQLQTLPLTAIGSPPPGPWLPEDLGIQTFPAYHKELFLGLGHERHDQLIRALSLWVKLVLPKETAEHRCDLLLQATDYMLSFPRSQGFDPKSVLDLLDDTLPQRLDLDGCDISAFRSATDNLHQYADTAAAAAAATIREAKQAALETKRRLERERIENRRAMAQAACVKRSGPGFRECVSAIVAGRVILGMTASEAVASWGGPKTVNRTETIHGVTEQWVYRTKYLYFDDGVLLSIQTTE